MPVFYPNLSSGCEVLIKANDCGASMKQEEPMPPGYSFRNSANTESAVYLLYLTPADIRKPDIHNKAATFIHFTIDQGYESADI